MFELFKALLEVGKFLFGISAQLKTAGRERRAAMATLFEQISGCLEGIASELRTGGQSHGKCGELLIYARAVPDAIRQEIGDAKANELGDLLLAAQTFRMAVVNVHDAGDRESYLQVIDETSGKFRALANLARVP